MRDAPSGTVIALDRNTRRLVAWHRLGKYPNIYARTSQPIDAALQDWRVRSIITALASLLGLAGFASLAVFGVRAAEARDKAEFAETLSREVHHRVKNSLQIVAGLLNARVRQAADPSLREALGETAKQVNAIATVNEMLQSAGQLDRIDLCALIDHLCEYLAKGTGRTVIHDKAQTFMAAASEASLVAIIANELITNGLKYGVAQVEVSCHRDVNDMVLTVRDDGPGLPAKFDLKEARLGLSTVSRLCARLGGHLTWAQHPGTSFEVRIPLRSLASGAAGQDRLQPPG